MDNNEMLILNSKAPKAPREYGVSLRLSELISQEAVPEYFDLAMISLAPLNLSQILFLVFCAWKLGRLGELESLRNSQLHGLSEVQFKIYREFLKAHLLRSQGQIKEGFAVLEQLRSQTREWVVHYRYAAEATAFYELSRAMKEIESINDQRPHWAEKVLSFNLGIIALNQGQLSLYSTIEKKFASSSDPLSLFFLSWMQGGYYQQLENNHRSVDCYLDAINLINELPNRKTDLPILAFLVLQQSVWAGDLKASRRSWAIIESVAKNRNTLSADSHSLAKAIYELNEGNLAEATLRFEVLFENTQWSKDHLRGGELFFWVLMARSDAQRGRRLVKLLMEIRQKIGFSDQYSLLPIYESYFSYLNHELTVTELQKRLLKQIDLYQIRGLEKGERITEFLIRLVDDDVQVRATAFDSIKHIPFLQRLGVALLSEQRVIPATLRHIKTLLTDEVARLMLDLHLSRFTEDLSLFVQTITRLGNQKVLAWGGLLHLFSSPLSLEFGKSLLNSELLVDGEARRVIAIESLENLDHQPLLAELTLSLFRNPSGLTKEMAALGVGYSNYDPIQHDPIIYNLISRLRDWLRKQGLSIKISSGRQGWCFNHRELIQGYFLDDSPELVSQVDHRADSAKRTLPPRLDWILTMIEKKGFVERADFMARFPIKKSTAANDFNKLIEMNLIVRQGQGRGIYYILKENLV